MTDFFIFTTLFFACAFFFVLKTNAESEKGIEYKKIRTYLCEQIARQKLARDMAEDNNLQNSLINCQGILYGFENVLEWVEDQQGLEEVEKRLKHGSNKTGRKNLAKLFEE